MGFTRRKDRKALQYRGAGGRFARTPSLESIGAVRVCRSCGQINLREPVNSVDGAEFLDPALFWGPWPENCKACGEKLKS